MHQCWDSFDLALDILATRKERLATNTNIMKKVEQLLYVTNHYYEVLEKANKIFGMQEQEAYMNGNICMMGGGYTRHIVHQ